MQVNVWWVGVGAVAGYAFHAWRIRRTNEYVERMSNMLATLHLAMKPSDDPDDDDDEVKSDSSVGAID